MLPKPYRLRRSRDFARVRRAGRSSGTALLVLYVLSTRTPELRVGFSVSKRVGQAAVRNRIKRRMREAVRHQLPSVRPGQDLVFIARPASAAASYQQIAESIAILLRRTGAMLQQTGTSRNA